MSAHPTELELDSLRDGPNGDEQVARHVAACVECRALLATLRGLALAPAPADVPASVDETVLEAARAAGRRVTGGRRRRAALGVVGTALAAAAALLILWHPAPAPPTVAAPPALHDFNGDGRLDILDAFGMARALEAGRTPGGDFDLNRDGAIDRADVDALARAAVDVEGGG